MFGVFVLRFGEFLCLLLFFSFSSCALHLSRLMPSVKRTFYLFGVCASGTLCQAEEGVEVPREEGRRISNLLLYGLAIEWFVTPE